LCPGLPENLGTVPDTLRTAYRAVPDEQRRNTYPAGWKLSRAAFSTVASLNSQSILVGLLHRNGLAGAKARRSTAAQCKRDFVEFRVMGGT